MSRLALALLTVLPLGALPAALAAAALPAAAAPAPAAVGSGVLRLWAPASVGRVPGLDRAKALQIARDHDLVLAQGSVFAPYADAMRAANPRLRLIAYVNGSFAGSREGSRYPDAWYLRDASGARVTSLRYGNFMMDVREPGWIGTRTTACRTVTDRSDYDGCYLDVLGSSPVGEDYVSGRALNPATGRPWTYAEWLSGTAALAGEVRRAAAPRLVQGNGLTDGPRYFAPIHARTLFSTLDTVIAEGFVRSGRAALTTFPTATEWQQNVAMLQDAERQGKRVLAITKLWAEGTPQQKDAWHEYSLATFLMGAGGRSRYYLSYEESQDPTSVHPWWRTDLGQPTGAMTGSAGVHSRSFERGRVLVNVSRQTVRVPLGGSYRTLYGRTVTSVTIPPDRARVLTRV